VLSEYREHPDDFYMLRVGYGGTMGALTDIDQEGFLSPAFHSFPDMMVPDPLSGDNGPNFFGHVWNTATYVVNHPEFGWLAFGGNVKTEGDAVRVTPLDSRRDRVYLAPAGLWLTLDSGKFETVEFNSKTQKVRLSLAPSTQSTSAARLRLEQPAKPAGVGSFTPGEKFSSERGAWVIPLKAGATVVELSASPAN
jgi:hypothetical protein